MGTATVRMLDVAELRGEIETLEARLGMTIDEAELRESAGLLTPDQYEALARLRDAKWLAEAD